MLARSRLAENGIRYGTLGGLAALAVAFPLIEGSRDAAAHTASGRIGMYADRTANAEKIGVVVMGSEVLSVGRVGGLNQVAVAGALAFPGGTSGVARIKAAAVAGTPADLVLPTTSGAAGNVLTTDGAGVLSWSSGVVLLTDAVVLSPDSGTRNLVIPQGNYPGLTIRAGVAATNPLATWENESAQVVTQINSDGSFYTAMRATIQSITVGNASNGDTSTTVVGNTANGRSQDVAIGMNALAGSTTTGCVNNTAVGYNSQPTGGASCANNTSVGSSTLASLAAGGARNTVVGAFSGASITSGTGNVCVGYFAGRYATGSDEFYLTNRDHSNTTNEKIQALLYGNFNTTITSAFLRLNGRLRVNLSASSTDNSGTGIPSGQSFVFYGVSQVNAGATSFLDTFSGSGVGCEFAGRSSRGSAASPTATQSGDTLCRLTGYGRGASAFSTTYRAGILLRAAEAWTATAQGTRLDFETTTPGTTTTALRMRVWGDGGVSIDGTMAASPGAGSLTVGGDIIAETVGKGYKVKEGVNATMGVATLVAGTVTVNTTKVTANSRIFLQAQDGASGPHALHVSARTAGVSFTITSSNGGDTSAIAWLIVEPA